MPVEKWVCAKKSLSDIDLILVFVESGIILSNCVNDSLKSFGIYLNSFFVRFCPKRLKESKSPNIKMLCFICLCLLFVLQPTVWLWFRCVKIREDFPPKTEDSKFARTFRKESQKQ